jgi:hypothetical protein
VETKLKQTRKRVSLAVRIMLMMRSSNKMKARESLLKPTVDCIAVGLMPATRGWWYYI